VKKRRLISNGQIPDLAQPTPFLRWAGGKRRLTDLLIDSFPESFEPKSNSYFEPFIGGGALVFALGDKTRERYIPGKNLYLNDSNPELIVTYQVVRSEIDSLIKKLSRLAQDTSKSAYEKVRSSSPQDEIGRAARFIYLNKTCFNGLWRVNSKGVFNVPWGKLKDPLIFDEESLYACSNRLKGAHISRGDFGKAAAKAKKGDLVYFDPPYLPLTASASFSKYAKDDFTVEDHQRLADLIKALTKKGVHVILSNSDTPLSREIFLPVLALRQISMNRSISASGNSRKPVMEILGTNFPIAKDATLYKHRKINTNKR
jgi:DNA adenine methylase